MIFSRGAEAVLSKKTFLGMQVVIKNRIDKQYRVKALDTKLRTERTRREARLLHKAKLAGVMCPTVLEVSRYGLVLTFLKGKKIERLTTQQAFLAGNALAKLHGADIIHGDFTPANLLFAQNKVQIIDFGLGFSSNDIEDKAIDVLTMLKALNSEAGTAFLRGYMPYKDCKRVLARVEVVKSRARYA